MEKTFQVGQLKVRCFSTREEMGAAGAQQAAALIRSVCRERGEANLIFASSPSQMDVLHALQQEDVDWSCVNAFHMDEYIGVGIDHPASFARYLRENFFSALPLKGVYYLNGLAPDIPAECARYSRLLEQHPTDITFAGIGENGHMAFNDPYLADFFEPRLVKVNGGLDEVCRRQQVRDGWFSSLDEVPVGAMTLTFPALLRAPHLIVTAPSETKADIVQKVLEGPICLEVPSSVARLHRDAVLYLDAAAAARLQQ
jgi:glucosamine-6-phosphate deaminase